MNLYFNSLYIDELNKEAERKDIPWELLRGKKILITGASGMIGGYIIDLLMTRNNLFGGETEIYALSRSMAKLKRRFFQYEECKLLHLIEQDVCVEFGGKLSVAVDYIVHASSNTHPAEYAEDPIGTITTNVFGAYHLFEYMRRHLEKTCRMVILSSVEIYGENRGDVERFSEDYMGYLNCNTMRANYPESKRVSETLMQAYIQQYGMDAVSVRPGRIYGACLEEDDSKALTQFIRNSVKGENIILKSDGNQIYSYVYIADAVRAVLAVMLNGKCGEAYNVSDKASDAKLRDVACYLAEIAGTEVVFESPNDSEAKGYSIATKALLDSDKLQTEVGWKAYYSLENGLKRVIRMLKEKSACKLIGENKGHG